VAAEQVLEPLLVVHWRQEGQVAQPRWNPLRIGHHLRVAVALGIPVGDIRHPHGRVEQAVIAALYKQVVIAPRIGSR
jgi:hypothetical protein